MTPLLAALAVTFVAWFAAGSTWNVRRGREAMRWMQAGLPVVGERTTVRWLGTSAVELAIAAARAPFEAVTIVVFLEPRDVPWMWALARSRGRRDTLIVRARLRGAPVEDLEALDRTSWSGREALRRVDARWSVREPATDDGLATFYAAPAALARADALLDVAARAGMAVRRLSLRRGDRRLELHVALPPPAVPARRFFEAVRALGERAAAGSPFPSVRPPSGSARAPPDGVPRSVGTP